MKCGGASQLLKSEKDLTHYEQLWFKEPDSESQQAQRAYGPYSRGSKRFKRITAQSAQQQLPLQAFLSLTDHGRLVRHVSYDDQSEY